MTVGGRCWVVRWMIAGASHPRNQTSAQGWNGSRFSRFVAGGVGCLGKHHSVPGDTGRHHGKTLDGVGTASAGGVPEPAAGRLSGSDSGGRSGGTLYVRELTGAGAAWLSAGEDAGKEDFRNRESFARSGIALPDAGVGRSGIRGGGIWHATSRRKWADHACRWQPARGWRGQDQRRYFLTARHHH